MVKIANVMIAVLLAAVGIQVATVHHLAVGYNYAELLQSVGNAVPLAAFSLNPFLF